MKRVIPAMLVAGGRLVKGQSFGDHEDAGNPVTTARIYNDQLADEIIILDTEARRTGRGPDLDLLRRIAENCFVPIGFGGGIDSVQIAADALRSGADKVILNTQALERPTLISELAGRFGQQAVTVALDYRRVRDTRIVFTHNAQSNTGMELFEAIRRMCAAGSGEIMLTDVDREGRRAGPDLATIEEAARAIDRPVIAHGGIGSLEDFADILTGTGAQAAAAGRVFQFSDFNLIKVRRYLIQHGVRMRLA